MKTVSFLALNKHHNSNQLIHSDNDLKAYLLAQKINHSEGVYAGEDSAALDDYLACGVDDLNVLENSNDNDQALVCADFVKQNNYDYVFCGTQASGFYESGLFAYIVAKQNNMELIANVLTVDVKNRKVVQFLPMGIRRTLDLPEKCVFTVHPLADVSYEYIHERIKKGNKHITTITNKHPNTWLNGWQEVSHHKKQYLEFKPSRKAHERMQNALVVEHSSTQIVNDKQAEFLLDFLHKS